MTREEKISAIYKEMANKKFTLGCKINVKYRAYYHNETGGEVSYAKEENLIVWTDWVAKNSEIEVSSSDMLNTDKNWYIEDLEILVETIWHPVMIGTIFEWYSSSKWFINSQFITKLIDKWTGYDKPIDDQSDECIDYVYSLIPSKSME